VDPVAAPIERNGQVYLLTDDVSSSVDGIVVECSNVTLDGAGHVVQASGSGIGVNLADVSNVTITNTTIREFYHGIVLNYSDNSVIFGNDLRSNHYGISLYFSSGNNVSRNSVTNNAGGIRLDSSSGNWFVHNDIVNNTRQILTYKLTNIWDNGYPSGGNFWGDYVSRYPNASELNSSGIWDTAYIIDSSNLDHYPLMNPVIPEFSFLPVLFLLMTVTLLFAVVCRNKRAYFVCDD
jgi:parallel beta-helix repeat protein